VPPLSHLFYYTPIKSYLYFDIILATIMSEPAQYRLLTFHIQNPMSIFLSFGGLSKESVQVWGLLWRIETSFFFYGEGLLAPLSITKLKDRLLSAVRDCLFNIFAATFLIWRPSPPSVTWGRAMSWWQRTYLTWTRNAYFTLIENPYYEGSRMLLRCMYENDFRINLKIKYSLNIFAGQYAVQQTSWPWIFELY
jgi:hypothetical protein